MEQYKITLEAARVNAGLTQKDVADKMGVNRTTIMSWESGKTLPNIAQFDQFCAICKAPKDIIFLKSL